MNSTKDALLSALTDALTLSRVPGIGVRRYALLVRRFGSAGKVLEASCTSLESCEGISQVIARAIKEHTEKHERAESARIADKIFQFGWHVYLLGSDGYPTLLAAIADPPAILFATGVPMTGEEKCIGVVGTRMASDKGRQFTSTLCHRLAERDIAVVSGMAEGIDSAAHTGALEGGGKTIAVLGCSLDLMYKSTRRHLAESIAAQGTVVSEYLPETHPTLGTYPERNRIISGLSSGVVVVEAGQKSGALITANLAGEQGRTVFAVPGFPDSSKSLGTNNLIKQGARLLTSADDIFEELPQLAGGVASVRRLSIPEMSDAERAIMGSFSDGPKQIDQLSRQHNLPIADLMQFLLALEMKGVVRELSGKRFTISDDFR